jgi:hypothetical protein
MECQTQFIRQNLPQPQSSSPLLNDVEFSPLASPGGHFLEYARLLVIFLKLYCQARILVVRNHLLSFKLQLWEVVFLYFRVRIFFTRLANGFPVGQCWPRE